MSNYDDKRIENIECGMGIKDCEMIPVLVVAPLPKPLEGWKEKCILNKTTEYADFKVMNSDVLECVEFNTPNYCYYKTENSSNMNIEYHLCKDNLEVFYNRVREDIYYDGCVDNDDDVKLLNDIGCYEDFIERWNETVCIEKILVWEVEKDE